MSNPTPDQPRYSPDRRWYWNGHAWKATPQRPARIGRGPGIALVAFGIALAAGVEVFGWALPELARQAVRDPANAGSGSLGFAVWLLFVVALGGAALANGLVWIGARRA